MIPLGLSVTEQRLFHEALRAPERRVRHRVAFLNLEEEHVSDVSGRVLDGTVTVDMDAEQVDRSLSLQLLDPNRTLGVDSDHPDDGQAYLDRMAATFYSLWVPPMGRWVTTPTFCGPVTAMDRDGDTVTFEGQGKERFGWVQLNRTRTWRKGLTRVGVIRSLLEEGTGEDKFRLPSGWPAPLAEDLALGPRNTPWPWARRLATSMRAQLFYDGRGRAALRRYPINPVWTFDEDMLATKPHVSYDALAEFNTVHVTGAVPKGKKEPLKAHRSIPYPHPLSPERMGRNGRPRYLVEEIEDDTLTKQSEVDAAAARWVKEKAAVDSEVTFEVGLPVPHLEPGDLYRTQAYGVHAQSALRKFTIPVTHNGTQSIGTTRRVVPNHRRVRTRRSVRR